MVRQRGGAVPQPQGGGTPSAASLFQIANSGIGASREVGPIPVEDARPNVNCESVVVPDEQGHDIEIHPRAPQDDLVLLLRYLILEDLGDNPGEEAIAENKDTAGKLFKKLTTLANGRGVHIVGAVQQAVECSLREGTFTVIDGKSARSDADGNPNLKDNKVIQAFFGRDVFNRLNDRCHAHKKSNRSGLIAGLKHGLASQTL